MASDLSPDIPEAEETTPPNEPAETESTMSETSENTDPAFQNEEWEIRPAAGNYWTWQVEEGQSFWRLYQDVYEGRMEWDDYYTRLVELNPNYRNFHYIWVGDSYPVPAIP
ncbi:MAG: hypothetical protein PQJ59_14140 [Spirochaetales bacterium]|nr:hypothetical protein [Spirochaetales bacterium]